MITIETINFDKVSGFLTTFRELPKKALSTSYIVENNTFQTYAVYMYYSKKGNKTYLIKTL
jgi:hypothetical protein